MLLQLLRRPKLVYEIAPVREDWVLTEDKVPESRPHDLVAERLRDLLVAWAQRTGRRVAVCRNLAVRWDEARPAIGVDPDVCVLEPPPPQGDELMSLLLWDTGHFPPCLAVEIVSASRADKDYGQSPEKYAANGTRELWVFDPKMAGPKAYGGPFRLQVWRRDADDDFQRVYAGAGPVWSEAVQGWLFAVNEGRSLRLADDEAGTSWWMTGEEAERAAKEAERAAKEAERAAKEAERAVKERFAAKLRELGVDPDSIE
jgi:Uma2 family endonuclease